ncbi:F-box/FBD/LRR-repeat protein At3g52680 [Linum perenne]
MKKKRGKSTAIPVAAGEAEDRISELPDEILHKILWNVTSSKQVTKTSVLSRRWQSLWGTYPDVEFDKEEYGGRHGSIITAAFHKFVDASIEKFALNGQLSMRTLDIRIDGVQTKPYRFPPIQRLLKLASARNAESVTILSGISNVPNLEYFRIDSCLSPEEIEIEAPALETLRLTVSNRVTKLHLITPQLTYLDIEHYSSLTGEALCPVISKLQSLKFLSLYSLEELGKKLKLSIPTLEFTLFEEVSDDLPKHPTTINHLKLHTSLSTKGDHEGVLGAMFWICRPKFLTLVPKPSISKEFFQILLNIKLSQYSSDELRINMYGKWQDQLKDVKIVKGDVDRVVEGRGEEMELMDVSKDMVTLLATEKQVCFLLTWC